jgi:hypothetical protein
MGNHHNDNHYTQCGHSYFAVSVVATRAAIHPTTEVVGFPA